MQKLIVVLLFMALATAVLEATTTNPPATMVSGGSNLPMITGSLPHDLHLSTPASAAVSTSQPIALLSLLPALLYSVYKLL